MKNLKFIRNYLLLFGISILAVVSFTFFSCSDSESSGKSEVVKQEPYKCFNCKTEPIAKVEFDNSYQGYYVGVSTRGSLIINFRNNDDLLTATLKIDSDVINLTAKNILIDKNNYSASFLGNFNDKKVSFVFSVDGFGKNPQITESNLPDMFYVNKEMSNAMIEVFQGVYYVRSSSTSDGPLGDFANRAINDPDSNSDLNTFHVVGKFNVLVSRSESGKINNWWRGISNVNGNMYLQSGSINTSAQLVDGQDLMVGALNIDEIRGVFQGTPNSGFHLIANRTL